MIYEESDRLKYYSLNFSTSLIGQEILRWDFIGESDYSFGSQIMDVVSYPTFYHPMSDGTVPIFSEKYRYEEEDLCELLCGNETLSIHYDNWSIKNGVINGNHLPFRLPEANCIEMSCGFFDMNVYFLQFKI